MLADSKAFRALGWPDLHYIHGHDVGAIYLVCVCASHEALGLVRRSLPHFFLGAYLACANTIHDISRGLAAGSGLVESVCSTGTGTNAIANPDPDPDTKSVALANPNVCDRGSNRYALTTRTLPAD